MNGEAHRARAIREFERRAFYELAGTIDDPRLRRQAELLADGKITARQAADFVDHSPEGTRRLQEFITQWRSLGPERQQEVVALAERHIDEIEAEFAIEDDHPKTPGRTAPARPDHEDDEDFSEVDWLEGP